MDCKVTITAYSGDTLVSCREMDINDYYDSDIPEIDNTDHILSNKIDRVEQVFYEEEVITRINYYNEKGVPYKFDEIKNGVCTTETV